MPPRPSKVVAIVELGSDLLADALAQAILCIGVEEGRLWRGDRHPIGTPLTMGLTMALGMNGSQDWDAGGGDYCEDPSGPFCAGQGGEDDLPRVWLIAECGPEGIAVW